MPRYFVDLHIHIGSTFDNRPVKITASRRLNVINIIEECVNRKGIDFIGIVDSASPGVLKDFETLLKSGYLMELKNGGLSYQDKLTIIPGVEVESSEKNGGRGHYLSFFPTLAQVKEYGIFLSQYIKNINLSTQQSYLSALELCVKTNEIGGMFFPAHAFTPHKSMFGSCGDSLESIFNSAKPLIKVLELGLSSDSQMADIIPELHPLTFLSNSDAHSLEKIGREYNVLELAEPTYAGLMQVFLKEEGKVIANYGLDPKLGKYYRSYCEKCQKTLPDKVNDFLCPYCSSSQITKGVSNRLLEIGEPTSKSPIDRPPYHYQIPLSFLPNVGPKTIEKLIDNFKTEMNVLHSVGYHDLEKIVGEKVARTIEMARKGQIEIIPGGGGVYGKLTEAKRDNYNS